MSISIFSAVCNRADPLKHTVLSWLYRTIASEIVLLDWCSNDEPKSVVEQAIKESNKRPKSELRNWEERLKFYRVVNDDIPWRIGYGSNIAAKLCTGNVLMKIDADCVLVGGEGIELPNNTFYNGNMNCQHENDRGIFGSFMMKASDYWQVGGIDERYNTYGHEDLDLFIRLTNNGLERHDFPNGTIFHLPHGNSRRMENYNSKDDIYTSTKKNRELCEKWNKIGNQWGPHQPHLNYEISLDKGWYKEIKVFQGEKVLDESEDFVA